MSKKKKYLYIIIGILLFSLILFRGCYYETKYYEFNDVRKKYEWGEVFVGLGGSNARDGSIELQGSPYNLFISIKIAKKGIGTATIDKVSLLNTNGEVVFKSDEAMKNDISLRDIDKAYVASFVIKNIELDYENHTIMFNINVKTESFSYSDNVEMYFKKNYREEKSNRLWDAFMSV